MLAGAFSCPVSTRVSTPLRGGQQICDVLGRDTSPIADEMDGEITRDLACTVAHQLRHDAHVFAATQGERSEQLAEIVEALMA
jgi:hypothetical protein